MMEQHGQLLAFSAQEWVTMVSDFVGCRSILVHFQ